MADYENTQAPFNFAIATLMRLDKLLQQISYVSVIRDGNNQQIKYDLVAQFLVNASVLIKDRKNKKGQTAEDVLKNKLSKIKLKRFATTDMSGQTTSNKIIYDEEVNKELDYFLIEVNNILQNSGGYFMPTEDDDGL